MSDKDNEKEPSWRIPRTSDCGSPGAGDDGAGVREGTVAESAAPDDGGAEASAAGEAETVAEASETGRPAKFGRLTGDGADRRKLTGMYKDWFLDYASVCDSGTCRASRRRRTEAGATAHPARDAQARRRTLQQGRQYHRLNDAVPSARRRFDRRRARAARAEGYADRLSGQLGNAWTGRRRRCAAVHRGAAVEVRARRRVQSEDHRVDALLRRPQSGARDASRPSFRCCSRRASRESPSDWRRKSCRTISTSWSTRRSPICAASRSSSIPISRRAGCAT